MTAKEANQAGMQFVGEIEIGFTGREGELYASAENLDEVRKAYDSLEEGSTPQTDAGPCSAQQLCESAGGVVVGA